MAAAAAAAAAVAVVAAAAAAVGAGNETRKYDTDFPGFSSVNGHLSNSF